MDSDTHSGPSKESAEAEPKTTFVGSVVFMGSAWLLLTCALVLICVERIQTVNVVLFTLMVFAWCLAPVQVLRYFRERKEER
jgi:hypothetical protein